MSVFKDWSIYLNTKIGRLTIVDYYRDSKTQRIYFICQCDCGNIVNVLASNVLKAKGTKSCGCLHNEIRKIATKKHGMSKKRPYNIWCGMKARCENPKIAKYKNYGGRGIKVCEEWKDFTVFYKWAITHGYKDNLTIDRIDNNGDYEPNNCRWVNNYTQARNKTNNHLISYKGETKPISEWAEKFGINYWNFYHRMQIYNFSMEETLDYYEGLINVDI